MTFTDQDTVESLIAEYRQAYAWGQLTAGDWIWWSMQHCGRPDMNMLNRYER